MASAKTHSVLRRIPQSVDHPLIRNPQPWLDAKGEVYISKDGYGLADALRQRFIEKNIQATVVDGPDKMTEDCKLFVHLAAIRFYESITQATQMNREAFLFTKKASALLSDQGTLILVQDTGGHFNFDGGCDPLRAPLGGLSGLAKTANQEWETINARTIDLDAGYRNVGELADILCEEIRFGYETEIGLPEGKRITVQHIEKAAEMSMTRLHPNSVVLASGGARGVTAACMIELARHAPVRFALLGRTPIIDEPLHLTDAKTDAELKKAIVVHAKEKGRKITPRDIAKEASDILKSREIQATLNTIEKYGSLANYYAVDVNDLSKLSDTTDKIRTEMGPISALIHGAGVLADKAIKDKSIDDFDWVFNTKVNGFFALLATTAADPIDTICVFSSVAGRFGNVGQSDYAMANEVLNKTAAIEASRRVGCLVKSLAWGPWAGGMVTESLRKVFETRGVALVDIDAGAKQFVREILEDEPNSIEVVLGAGLAKPVNSITISKTLDLETHPFLSDHSVKGIIVIPMVLGIEYFEEIAKRHFGELAIGKTIAIENVTVLKGLHLSNNQKLELKIQSEKDRTALALEIISKKGVHYRATAIIHENLNSLTNNPIGFSQFLKWNGTLYDGDILFHGNAFQFLHSISAPDSDRVFATMKRNANTWSARFETDVLARDGSLQLGVIAASFQTKSLVVPTSIQRVARVSESTATRVVAQLKDLTKIAATYDFELYDDDNELVEIMRGARFQTYEKR